MSDPFSVNTVFFTVLDYPMSYIEFFGTVLYLWSVWLIAQRNVLTWPVGIASVLLYMALFYQIRLYSDALEQVYYLGASAYGWWYWSRSRPERHPSVDVSYSSGRALLGWLAVTVVLSAALGWTMGRVHVWTPALFPEPASYPYLDALTTVMSLTAMWLMARKHIESWFYWIVVDIIGIGLYFAKEIKFVALLYALLLALAVRGWIAWNRAGARRANERRPSDELVPPAPAVGWELRVERPGAGISADSLWIERGGFPRGRLKKVRMMRPIPGIGPAGSLFPQPPRPRTTGRCPFSPTA